MLNLFPWKEDISYIIYPISYMKTGFENLKNSNPGPLVHDRVVEAEDGNVIVIPLSLSALSKYFEIWM